MNPLESIAFVLGIVNVTLVVRRSVWNYPFGIAMVLLYAVIFREARLYSDTLLQLFFLVVNVYGWWTWSRVRADAGEVVVERMTPRQRRSWVAGCVFAAAVWGMLMYRLTDASYAWWDAGIAAASVAAQVLMARRKLENWVVWIGVDIGSIGLYATKALWLTTALYAIFLALSIWGLIDWRAAERRQARA